MLGQSPHIQPATSSAGRAIRGIRYEDWKSSIQMAMDVHDLVRTVREYLAEWRPDELAELPIEVGATALSHSSEIPVRAVLAAHAELRFQGDPETGDLLRQMSLTLTAAATRLRYLLAVRARESASESGPG